MFKSAHLAIGIRSNGGIEVVGSENEVNAQCELERKALESGKFKRVIRFNDDESVYELEVTRSYSYKQLS